jgi:pilus assembly protein CpaB
MRRPGTILLLAVVLGALSAAMVYRQMRLQQEQVALARRAASGATSDLVVAAEPIPVGTRIAPNQVRVVPWPADIVPEGAIVKPEGAVGAVAKASLATNQPIVQSQLIPQGAGLLPLIITDGMRGMSVRVDSVTGVSGFITPNSHVDVVVAGTPTGDQDMRSKIVLQNVRVLATGTSIEQKDEKPVEVPTVTLLVSPEEAERLALATRQEPVRLALRNYHDDDAVHTAGVTTRQLFSDGTPTLGPAKTPVRRVEGGKYSVEILLGDKSTRQTLF